MKLTSTLAFLLLMGLYACSENDVLPNENKANESLAVLKLMQKVCDWQLQNPSERINESNEMWERAVFYLGVMATYHSTQEQKYQEAALNWGKENDFKLGPRRTHGDDQVIGQLYLELYDNYHDPKLIEDVAIVFDNMMNYSWSGKKVWNWCDGLFMAPPVLSHLAKVTQNQQYLVYMDSLWHDTYEMLYDEEYQLFYRDNRYIDTVDVSGKKIFWSRGNGWVIAGIARVLDQLPKSHPSYEKYLQVYLEMAQSISLLQRPNGFWTSNLLDANIYPDPETSGTAFFTYAFAWGVNQGYLDEQIYLPVIKRAWLGMISAVNEKGRLGYVQQPWHEPGPVYAEGHQEYGTGGFLLAASEYYEYLATKETAD